ncbi:GNAT family N-acetyltransferase [Amycolatopsis sp. QT-25]|uniref:GNAT family N-acetyltransferase n=1 Tax=Amycolatopsis sp. QT-25 TaxID=3034022 RepID=UPI0023EE1CF8|nr:GNAT family N-acetyltransferase [Amycolatopsis sp. QT-25]WET82811.1 GNAT family N-acetyltransferase [Amycolatopsis sp. QT-25]
MTGDAAPAPDTGVEELRTARLLLRRPGPEDLDAIFALHTDPEACAHNPSDLLETRKDAELLLLRWSHQWNRYGFGYWTVRPHGSAETLGFCGVKIVGFRHRAVLNLFYRFFPSSWGAGYAGEAATAVVGWARVHRPDDLVIARVRPENVASQRVALRAGLVRAAHLDSPGDDGTDWFYVSKGAGEG